MYNLAKQIVLETTGRDEWTQTKIVNWHMSLNRDLRRISVDDRMTANQLLLKKIEAQETRRDKVITAWKYLVKLREYSYDSTNPRI